MKLVEIKRKQVELNQRKQIKVNDGKIKLDKCMVEEKNEKGEIWKLRKESDKQVVNKGKNGD